MYYRIIVYRWDGAEPSAVIDLNQKNNAWFMFHRYCEIGPQTAENISVIELYEMSEKEAVCLSACHF